jgi:antitoxin component of MazEF toxin-antitoxin module
MVIRRKIKKSGNSLVLTMDSFLKEVLGIKKEDEVIIEVEEGKIVIRKGDETIDKVKVC